MLLQLLWKMLASSFESEYLKWHSGDTRGWEGGKLSHGSTRPEPSQGAEVLHVEHSEFPAWLVGISGFQDFRSVLSLELAWTKEMGPQGRVQRKAA